MRISLNKSVAIVTGAGQGLGREIALALAAEGAILFLIGRNEQKLRAVCDAIRINGGSADYVIADITDFTSTGYIDDILNEQGKIDILVNNAGWSPKQKPIEELTYEELQRTFSTNLFGIFYLLKKIIPILKKQNSGTIVNISSRAGRVGYPRISAYSSSKFAVEGLTQAVAKELENTNIKCYSVAPGALNTPMRQELFGDADRKQDPAQAARHIVRLINGSTHVGNGDSVII